jgi:hypothetical protein
MTFRRAELYGKTFRYTELYGKTFRSIELDSAAAGFTCYC